MPLHTYEPDKANYGLLYANKALNKVSGFVFRLGVGVGQGKWAEIIANTSNNSGMKRLVEVEEPTDTSIQIISLDSHITVLSVNGPVGLIKIDVEGNEVDVILGAKKLISTQRPVIAIETDKPNIVQELLPSGYIRQKTKNATDTYIFWPLPLI